MIDITQKDPEELYRKFRKALYTSIGMGTLISIIATEAIDAMDADKWEKKDRRIYSMIKAVEFAVDDLDRAGRKLTRTEEARAWVADFAVDARRTCEPHLQKLQFAIANNLGRLKGVDDINAMAKIIIARCMAKERGDIQTEQKKEFAGCYMKTDRGGQRAAVNVLTSISCAELAARLDKIIYAIFEPITPVDFDLTAGVDVMNGIKALNYTLCDVNTWEKARVKADELGHVHACI